MSNLFLGIDVGNRSSEFYLMDERGCKLDADRVSTLSEASWRIPYG